MSKLRDYWLGLSIVTKMRLFIVPLLLVVTVAAGFNLYTTRFSVQEVNRLLLEISRCENAQDAMRAEKDAFLTFVRAPGEENRASLEKMVTHTTGTISLLPYDYQTIGAERYAWTWRIKNAYRNYAAQRDSVLNILSVLNSPYDDDYVTVREEDVVDQLYEVYDMQEYLEGYMQSQIKPHFLFNTLNTISGMAELEDAEKTDSMIRSLSRLFQYRKWKKDRDEQNKDGQNGNLS